MRNIQHILMSGILVLSASSVLAATETKEHAMPAFHALSQVTDSRAQTMIPLTDTQLDTITGGAVVRSTQFELQMATSDMQNAEMGVPRIPIDRFGSFRTTEVAEGAGIQGGGVIISQINDNLTVQN